MKQKQAFPSIISSNPYNLSFYSGKINLLEHDKKPRFQKNQYSISFLKTKSFLTTKLEINKSIDADDLIDVIENKTYEELGLDIASEFLIEFFEIEREEDEKNRYYNVFVVDPEDIVTEFRPITEKIKYIDQIYPVPLLFKSLYKKEIIRDNGIDAFIYFSDADAFITLYKEGEFLYTKELNLAFENIHELFCEIYGERVDYDNFITLLIQEGLRTSHDENRETLLKLLNDILSQINEVFNFAKRAYNIEEINKLYIGSSLGPINGLDELAQTILGISTASLDFEYGYETTQFYVDQIHQLMHLTAQLPYQDRYDCNFTMFNRPPPFIHRESGRLLLIMAASIVLSLTWPIYNIAYTKYAEIENDTILNEQKVILQKQQLRQSQIETQTKIRTDLEAKKKVAIETQESLKKVLTMIHKQKVEYPMKAKIIANFTKDLNDLNINLTQLTFVKEEATHMDTFVFTLSATKDKYITNLIEKLTRENLKEYEISIEEISYSESQDSYMCILKVVLK